MRQQMEQHRTNAVCSSCHSRMDPIGFALENYDGVGAWRAKARQRDRCGGKLPDGTLFEGPSGLTQLLLTKYREQFISTFYRQAVDLCPGTRARVLRRSRRARDHARCRARQFNHSRINPVNYKKPAISNEENSFNMNDHPEIRFAPRAAARSGSVARLAAARLHDPGPWLPRA